MCDTHLRRPTAEVRPTRTKWRRRPPGNRSAWSRENSSAARKMKRGGVRVRRGGPTRQEDRPHTCSETNCRQRRPSKSADLPIGGARRRLCPPSGWPERHATRTRPPTPTAAATTTTNCRLKWPRIINDIIYHCYRRYCLKFSYLILLFSSW